MQLLLCLQELNHRVNRGHREKSGSVGEPGSGGREEIGVFVRSEAT